MTRAAFPTNVFLELNLECNLRCVQCDIYKLTNPSGELTLEERCGVIAQVADWHPDIRVVFAGGEPFLRRETLYSVAEAAADRGVYTTISTNGTLIRDADIERLPLSGVRCVVVSLDSDEPEVHDRIRGVPDTFKRATSAIRRLVEARDRTGADFSVLTSTILGSHNLDRVDAMVSCFESLGVNTTIFQPLQPAFAREMTSRWWTTDPLFPRDAFQVDRGMDQLIAARAAGRRVFQSEAGLEDIRYYLKNPRSLVPGQCAAMDRHLMVDMLGDVRLCFNMERIGLRPVANVRTRSLRETWEAAEIEAVRATMRACREGCGSMLCHAR
jgi:MoaA/NifB/PqqE/SkfB family radical SAM enzyme